jgi:hypothetical protein
MGGFWALVPLVLRREDFEGEEECDRGRLGRDILRDGWGLHGELHGEVEEKKEGSRQTVALWFIWSRDSTSQDFLHLHRQGQSRL